jgi:hypothetical protein
LTIPIISRRTLLPAWSHVTWKGQSIRASGWARRTLLDEPLEFGADVRGRRFEAVVRVAQLERRFTLLLADLEYVVGPEPNSGTRALAFRVGLDIEVD